MAILPAFNVMDQQRFVEGWYIQYNAPSLEELRLAQAFWFSTLAIIAPMLLAL